MLPSRSLVFLILAHVALGAAAAPTPAELADLFLPPRLYNPKLSPTGEFLGFQARRGDLRTIGIFDFARRRIDYTTASPKIVPTEFWWKGPQRVLVRTTDAKFEALGYSAFDVDGKNSEDASRLVGAGGVVIDALSSQPRHVLMANSREIKRVSLDSGTGENTSGSLEGVYDWILDAKGGARGAIRYDGQFGETEIWWCASPGGQWNRRTFKPDETRFLPVAVDENERNLCGWLVDPDTSFKVARLDTITGEIKSLDNLPGRDPTAILLLGRTRIPVALSYEHGQRARLIPLASTFAPAIQRLETAFPDQIVRILDVLPDRSKWLVWVGNSRLPGVFLLFDPATGEVTAIAPSHEPTLTEDRLSPGLHFNFTSPTGERPLSARIWRPKGTGPAPLIVICPDRLPAPPVIDVYEPIVQAFVEQGFAVLQVNIRNSWIWGKEGRQVAEDQWIPNLRSDLEAAVQTLIKKQVVDPQRLYLYGERFGGVLALQVAARSSLFAAIATVNVPRETHRDDLSNMAMFPGMNALAARLGGWRASEKVALALSPIRTAPELGIPALYLHNEDSIRGRVSEDGRDIAALASKSRARIKSDIAYHFTDRPLLPAAAALEGATVSTKIAAFFNEASAAPGK